MPVTCRPCFYKENLEDFHRYVRAGIEILVVYVNQLFTVEKQITKLVLDGLFID
jgi:hypothetical protein